MHSECIFAVLWHHCCGHSASKSFPVCVAHSWFSLSDRKRSNFNQPVKNRCWIPWSNCPWSGHICPAREFPTPTFALFHSESCREVPCWHGNQPSPVRQKWTPIAGTWSQCKFPETDSMYRSPLNLPTCSDLVSTLSSLFLTPAVAVFPLHHLWKRWRKALGTAVETPEVSLSGWTSLHCKPSKIPCASEENTGIRNQPTRALWMTELFNETIYLTIFHKVTCCDPVLHRILFRAFNCQSEIFIIVYGHKHWFCFSFWSLDGVDVCFWKYIQGRFHSSRHVQAKRGHVVVLLPTELPSHSAGCSFQTRVS